MEGIFEMHYEDSSDILIGDLLKGYFSFYHVLSKAQ